MQKLNPPHMTVVSRPAAQPTLRARRRLTRGIVGRTLAARLGLPAWAGHLLVLTALIGASLLVGPAWPLTIFFGVWLLLVDDLPVLGGTLRALAQRIGAPAWMVRFLFLIVTSPLVWLIGPLWPVIVYGVLWAITAYRALPKRGTA